MMLMLTIAIPNYNGGESLVRAVQSCRNIRIPIEMFEILVVDNQSTDDSLSLLESIKPNYPNLRIERNESNVGRIGNWNRLLDIANGTYMIMLFTNDEIYADNKIAESISYMNENDIYLGLSAFVAIEGEKKILGKIYNKDPVTVEGIKFSLDKLVKDIFPYPFAPIQSNIYSIPQIRHFQLRFDPTLELNGDQHFTFALAFRSPQILITPYPQILWHKDSERFHNKITIQQVIREDWDLYLRMLSEYHIQVDERDAIAAAFKVIIKNDVWSNVDRKEALAFVMELAERCL